MPLIADRLVRAMAEETQRRQRFHEEDKPVLKSEFINGKVVLKSPPAGPHMATMGALGCLVAAYVPNYVKGWQALGKVKMSLACNDYDPDLMFFREEKARTFKKDQRLLPAADFVIEVLSPCTEEIDRGIKMRDYAEHGVEEYWLVDPIECSVEQYLLGSAGKFVLHEKRHEGVIHCRVLKGFAMPLRAIFDLAENAKTAMALIVDYVQRA